MEDSMKHDAAEKAIKRMREIEARQTEILLDLIVEYMGQRTSEERVVLRNKIYADTEGEQQVRSLVGLLYDGLAFGNWPWSPKTIDAILAAANDMPPKGWDKV
jgi:hypothetical protein